MCKSDVQQRLSYKSAEKVLRNGEGKIIYVEKHIPIFHTTIVKTNKKANLTWTETQSKTKEREKNIYDLRYERISKEDNSPSYFKRILMFDYIHI